VVAHRGASAEEAEHTLAAYRRALDDGADGLECDVRLTRDGVLVCVHDRRVDRTSSGRGVVSTLELADLSELDFGSWHNGDDGEDPLLTANWEAPDYDRTRVLTLEVLLEMVTSVDRPVRLAIETKHPTRYAGLVESTLVETLEKFGLARPASGPAVRHRVQVMSFAPVGLRRIRQLAPDLPTVHLMKRIPLPRRDGTVSVNATIAGPSVEGLRAYPPYVDRAHARGHEVHVWTVDEPEDVDFLVELGVDVLITNRPAEVMAQVSQLASA
jgi:glycerophosphoryl diester phosphodiesterase